MPSSRSSTRQPRTANEEAVSSITTSYETGAFSANVTPPLSFSPPTVSSGPSTSKSSSLLPSIFGGLARATEARQSQVVVPDVALSSEQQEHNDSPSQATSRRMSFASSSDGSRGGTTPTTGASDNFRSRSNAAPAKSQQQANKAPPPAIPEELMAALALPPGTAINAYTIGTATVAGASLASKASPSHIKLPSLETFSPLNLKSADIPWSSASSSGNTSSPHLNSKNGHLSNRSSSASLRKKALLETSSISNASNTMSPNQPSTPHVTPATPPAKSTLFPLSNGKGRSIRKAASAESLRSVASTQRQNEQQGAKLEHTHAGASSLQDGAIHAMRGLGIIGTTSTITANFLPKPAPSPEESDAGTTTWSGGEPFRLQQIHQQQARSDMKSIWKSFSSKLNIRPSLNSTDRNVGESGSKASLLSGNTHTTGSNNLTAPTAPSSGSVTVGRKSFDSSIRHSLSIYPRRSSEKLPSTSTSHTDNWNRRGGTGERVSMTLSRDSVCFPRSRSEKEDLYIQAQGRDGLGNYFSAGGKKTTKTGGVDSVGQNISQSSLNSTSQASLAAIGVGAIPNKATRAGKGEFEDEHPTWLTQERFTHDLSQRKNRKTKLTVSSAALRSAAMSTTISAPTPANSVSTFSKQAATTALAGGSQSYTSTGSNLSAEHDGNDDGDEEELDEDEEEDDAEEDESELASQMSYIESIELIRDDIPASSSTDLSDITTSVHPLARRSPLRRNTSPTNLMASSTGGTEATLQQRQNVGMENTGMIPPRISTESTRSFAAVVHTVHNESANPTDAKAEVRSPTAKNADDQAKLLSPTVPALTPDTASTVYMDAFSSPSVSGSITPSKESSSFTFFPASPTSHSNTPAIEQAGSVNKQCRTGPPSPVHTVRPRSMSESCISNPVAGGNGNNGPEVRAAQPNKSTILNESILARRGIAEETEDEAEEDKHEQDGRGPNYVDQNEVGQRIVGHTQSYISATTPSGNTSSRSSVLGVNAPAGVQQHIAPSVSDASDSAKHLLTSSKETGSSSSADYTVAIVGPKLVGKSTIIANNLKLPENRCSVLYEDDSGNKVLSYSGSYSITGKTCTINILEVDMDLLKSTSEGLTWPGNVPRPEGVMVCYKYGDPKGLEHLKTLLHGFWTRGGIHLIALATQCPTVQEGAMPYKAEGDKAAEICNIHGAGLVHLDGGIDDPNRKARNSLQWILRKILESRGQSSRSPSKMKRPMQAKRSIATLLPEKNSLNASATNASPLLMKSSTEASHTASDTGHSLKTVSTMSDLSLGSKMASRDETSSGLKMSYSQMDIYLSRDNLVQKLLFAAAAGNDEEFVSSFLIVFRRFETPYRVLNCWLERFNVTSSHLDSDPLLSRQVHMSLCKILTRWLKFHPNDFCASSTRSLLQAIMVELYTYTWVIHWAMEIEDLLKNLEKLPDQDSAWTLPDAQETTQLHAQLLIVSAEKERRPSLAPSIGSGRTAASSFAPSMQTSINLSSQGSDLFDVECLPSAGLGSSVAQLEPEGSSSTQSLGKTAPMDNGPSLLLERLSQVSNHGLSRNEKLSAVLQLSNTFLDIPVQPLARQITKHAWDIFASMQPRDLLRYVMTPRDPKNPDARPLRNVENPVTKAVNFSNYLSNWTASLLLVQSKQKTRARVFEHLIRLALALRALDNLDCLMAVLVGLNSTPVHRLNDLATSMPEVIHKKFRSMNFLMASSRSFAAYRLALTTARPEVIPYLGVHLQDITRVHDGKSDMRDGLVNWSKMRQIGKYASAVAHCGRLTPRYLHDERLSKLVMDGPVFSLDSDDNTLYELSYSYKPRQKRSGSSSQTAKLKRLFKEAISTPS